MAKPRAHIELWKKLRSQCCEKSRDIVKRIRDVLRDGVELMLDAEARRITIDMYAEDFGSDFIEHITFFLTANGFQEKNG